MSNSKNTSRAKRENARTITPSKPIIMKVWETNKGQRMVCIPKQMKDIEVGDYVKVIKVNFIDEIKKEVKDE